MKNAIAVIALSLVGRITIAQSTDFIDYSLIDSGKGQVAAAIEKSGVPNDKITYGKMTARTATYLVYLKGDTSIAYFFNKDEICYGYMKTYPKSMLETAKKMLALYQIVDKTEWRTQDEVYTYSIYLTENPEDDTFSIEVTIIGRT